MSGEANTATGRHPAPARDEISLWALFFGLLAGPAGWIAQHLLVYGLAGYACYPQGFQLTAPAHNWSSLRPVLIAITGLGLALTAAGAWVAWRCWREVKDEAAGDHPDLLEVGAGRSRFLAMSGLLVSALFAAVILFEGVMLVGSPLCRD